MNTRRSFRYISLDGDDCAVVLIVIDIPVVRIGEQIGEDYISPEEEYWRAASRDMGCWELENVHASCAEIRQVCIRISLYYFQ